MIKLILFILGFILFINLFKFSNIGCTSTCTLGCCYPRTSGGCKSLDENKHHIPSSLIDPRDPYFEYDSHRLNHHLTLYTSGCEGCLK